MCFVLAFLGQLYMYVCIYIFMYVYVYLCMYMYIYLSIFNEIALYLCTASVCAPLLSVHRFCLCTAFVCAPLLSMHHLCLCTASVYVSLMRHPSTCPQTIDALPFVLYNIYYPVAALMLAINCFADSRPQILNFPRGPVRCV